MAARRHITRARSTVHPKGQAGVVFGQPAKYFHNELDGRFVAESQE